ncbi:MAG: hypothetical protein CO030_00290 [Candidatus Magasanikbacteria bacterium CG_4_9_14_0_2_um_filter_42_11]|uniref:Uncharacterized protein n=1 Tax=Candidatus Magasanikbacteria bacterium CG_4_9_14_0_2_um_filter_42_11 TaxID=1974643 RepID=A0A2M8FB39_9BACT|nr:MAG: hypothetical protein COU34_03995 [Candidatus Magasanikbacteria bacterium CG10_big_fil_rev_8_21_14_0_10_43_9]PIY93011.1 MAG: hypothetical protein COY70_00240 [Candidatus Magasanikbacteria bacterium CG_4_10_14_0_8_um_filter_42_12]PJC52931.1 MAG: hypothetical protein CO030_00290 [Candidatus Magasanikbacteria bacterium CG_4_9_14_0_2_um_filter_42_11]
MFDGQVFDITNFVDLSVMLKLDKKVIIRELHRRKDLYRWPQCGLECAFDFIEEAKGRIFFEVYSRNKKKVIDAKNVLEQLGYQDFISESYHQII